MIVAIIPAKNEAKNLKKVIMKLPLDSIDLIIPVLNGCTDDSLEVLKQLNCPVLAPVIFKESLGIDVPRAIGAIISKKMNAEGSLFVDGDMHGVETEVLKNLIQAVKYRDTDLALTNCYPDYISTQLSPTAASLIEMRKDLNRHLKLFDKISSATPSHGPHAVSRKLLKLATPYDFSVPPLLLSKSAEANLKVAVAAEIPHLLLGSTLRSYDHVDKIAETIIGDCLEALTRQNGRPGNRVKEGKAYIGYNKERRFDLLEQFEKGEIKHNFF
ncbi:glycosyltransferase family A protein [Desulfotruncus alcoholivorax]|uniref:glycosyltransferase family A protein n=1 Tax=Desulfotruncus alcoholivorax TaxID=265477 RepID=UPI000413642A|nr:glycosyltransferase family A protein [Desulfotruncus alcoholivorax]